MKSSLKHPVTSPKSNKVSSLASQRALNKFKVIKECEEENPESDYKQEVVTLRKYITELETTVSDSNIEYLYVKGLMEIAHKKAIELEARNNLENKEWQDRMGVKEREGEERSKEIQSLKMEG